MYTYKNISIYNRIMTATVSLFMERIKVNRRNITYTYIEAK